MPDTLEPQLDELRRRARRRLVGAVVLALAAAVIVPMLLESEPKPLGEDVSVRIPPVDDGRFVSKLGDNAKAGTPGAKAAERAGSSGEATTSAASKETRSEASASSAASAASESPAASASKTEETPSAATTAASAKPTEPAPRAETAKASSAATKSAALEPQKPAEAKGAANFSVQLAAFSDDKGANALAGRLKKAGHPAYTEPYTTTRGTLWRVRVGPYATREAAEAARAKLKADGQSGIIAAAQ